MSFLRDSGLTWKPRVVDAANHALPREPRQSFADDADADVVAATQLGRHGPLTGTHSPARIAARSSPYT